MGGIQQGLPAGHRLPGAADRGARYNVADSLRGGKWPMQPEPVAFLLKDNGQEVFVGVDLASGYCHVEGSEELYDKLCAFQGLDEYDLKNCFLVSQYISCLEKLGRLEEVLQNG